jgi:hypothetical protein
VNEQDWQACKDPAIMFAHMSGSGTSTRKWRLLACACARECWEKITDPRVTECIVVAERYADRMAREVEMLKAHNECASSLACFVTANRAACEAATLNAEVAASRARAYAVDAAREAEGQPGRIRTWNKQCEYFRCIFGLLPFRPVTMNQSWLTTNVVSLAQAIYDHRRFQDMPILADALEDAGCTNEEVLAHCRGEKLHVRGCWVVDLVLGKE